MINDLMNLEGVTVLDKKEQSKITGGGMCRIHTVNLGFSQESEGYFEGDSEAANSYCVDLITAGHADRCGYDCEHDGYGQ